MCFVYWHMHLLELGHRINGPLQSMWDYFKPDKQDQSLWQALLFALIYLPTITTWQVVSCFYPFQGKFKENIETYLILAMPEVTATFCSLRASNWHHFSFGKCLFISDDPSPSFHGTYNVSNWNINSIYLCQEEHCGKWGNIWISRELNKIWCWKCCLKRVGSWIYEAMKHMSYEI